MTILLALMAALQTVPAPPAATPPPEPPLASPINLATLPPLTWRTPPQVTPELSAFVAAEIKAGRCAATKVPLDLDLVVMVRGDGIVRQVVPRAIDCPTVEQFGAGLVTSFERSNLRTPAAGWYRATLSFTWER